MSNGLTPDWDRSCEHVKDPEGRTYVCRGCAEAALAAERSAHEETRRERDAAREVRAIVKDLCAEQIRVAREEVAAERSAHEETRRERAAIDVQLQQTQADYGAMEARAERAEAALSRTRELLRELAEGRERCLCRLAREALAGD